MSRSADPVFLCDAPGCKSRCSLSAADAPFEEALAARGWAVVPRPDADAKTYCPGCKAFGKVPAE